MEKERDLREFAERVKKKYKDKIEKIVLFGSLARGEHRETSDTDLLVITSGNPFDMQKRLSEVAVDILLENGVYVSPKSSHLERIRTHEKSKNRLPEHSQGRRNRWTKPGYS